MASNKATPTFKRKLLATAVISCFAVGTVEANPNGATVAHGTATFSTSGSTLTVTNTPNAIINWANFSIDSGETVRFVQQSSASAVLNRVTGSNPSQILGALQSNGKVFLVNPNGILFGANAKINVNGLVASSLNITDSDFLNGKLKFNADRANPGAVTNAGQIATPAGGFVYLLAPNVENSGVITTPSGEAILAGGNSIEIVDSVDPSQRVVVSATSQDVNLSQLMTQSNGNIFTVLNSGKISANTATTDKTGRIFLKSAGDIQTTSTSVIEAKGSTSLDGGSIRAFAEANGLYKGSFDASGKNGGFLETSGSYLEVNDADITLKALSSSGQGGTWLIDPTDVQISYGGTCTGGFTGTCLNASTISNQLLTANVSINTSGTGGNGDIQVNSNAVISNGFYGSSLSLVADRDLLINGTLNITSATATLSAARNLTLSSTGSVTARTARLVASGNASINGSISADTINVSASNVALTGASLLSSPSSGAASISLAATGAMSIIRSTISAESDDTAAGSNATVKLTAGGPITVNSSTSVQAIVDSGSANNAQTTITSGGDITFTGSSFSTQNSAGGLGNTTIVANKGNLRLDNSTLATLSEMSITTGGRIYLTNSSKIDVTSPNTLFFVFPLLGSNGWSVDGVVNGYGTAGSGSYIIVNNTVPILGSDFFATYTTLTPSTMGVIYNTPSNALTPSDPVPTGITSGLPTIGDFFPTGPTNPPGLNRDETPQQCS